MAWNTTLRAYEGLLYSKFRMSGALHWILTLKMHHRKREGYGLQFCPVCLAEDSIPYFRKCWRVAFNTMCTKHGTMLLDRCPKCGAAIAVHRLDMVSPDAIEIAPMSYCHTCKFDLRNAQTLKPISFDTQATAQLIEANRALDANYSEGARWGLGQYAVMHQLCRLMTSRYKHVSLREFVLNEIGFEDMTLAKGHISFEMRSIQERHYLMQLTAWLLVDVELRLKAAWRAHAVRYNVLVKDFIGCPDWYEMIVEKFSDWRRRLDN